MSIQLETTNLLNTQQMAVAVNGPDGATHLILCTGVAHLVNTGHETWTFLVGPQISQRQFVGAIASGALSTVQVIDKVLPRNNSVAELEAHLISIKASYDQEYGQVKVTAEVASSIKMKKLAISYNVSILAELPMY